MIAYVKNHTDFYWEESIQELEEKILSKVGEEPGMKTKQTWSASMRREWDPRVTFQEVTTNPYRLPFADRGDAIKKGLSKAIDSRFVSTITDHHRISRKSLPDWLASLERECRLIPMSKH